MTGTPWDDHDIEAALELIDRLLLGDDPAGVLVIPARPAAVAEMIMGLRSLVECLARDLADEMGIPGQARIVIEEYVASLSVNVTLGLATRSLDEHSTAVTPPA